MSVLSLDKRLRALEQTRSTADAGCQPFMGGINFLMMLAASYLGGLSGNDSVAEAYSRALGYETTRDFRVALTSGEGSDAYADLNRRRTEATVRLLMLKDAAINDPGEVRAALRSLWSELPEHARQHHFARDIEANLDQAIDWLCA